MAKYLRRFSLFVTILQITFICGILAQDVEELLSSKTALYFYEIGKAFIEFDQASIISHINLTNILEEINHSKLLHDDLKICKDKNMTQNCNTPKRNLKKIDSQIKQSEQIFSNIFQIIDKTKTKYEENRASFICGSLDFEDYVYFQDIKKDQLAKEPIMANMTLDLIPVFHFVNNDELSVISLQKRTDNLLRQLTNIQTSILYASKRYFPDRNLDEEFQNNFEKAIHKTVFVASRTHPTSLKGTYYLNTATPRLIVYYYNGILTFLLQMSITEDKSLTIFKMIPVPFADNNGKYKTLDLQNSHMAISDSKYIMSNNFSQDCAQYFSGAQSNLYICRSSLTKSTVKEPTCETLFYKLNSMIIRSPCQQIDMDHNTYIQKINKRKWLFVAPHPIMLTFACKNKYTNVTLPKKGILSLDDDCTLWMGSEGPFDLNKTSDVTKFIELFKLEVETMDSRNLTIAIVIAFSILTVIVILYAKNKKPREICWRKNEI